MDRLFGSSKIDLSKKLISLKTNLRNKPIKQIGIILDKDDYSVSDRLALMNKAILEAEIFVPSFTENVSTVEYTIHSSRTIIMSYFIIKDGQDHGNIETLLFELITAKPNSADCLKTWKECSETQRVKVKQADYLKEWLKIYVRYDYCLQNNLQSHAGENCTLQKSFENMTKEYPPVKAWNFETPILGDLKTYLKGFL